MKSPDRAHASPTPSLSFRRRTAFGRAVLGILIVVLGTTVFGEESHRYLVATRRAGPLAIGSLAQQLGDAPARRMDAFHLVNGFAVTLTATEAAELRRSPEVRWVEPVVERHLMVDESVPGFQTLPFGIQQVQAPLAWAGRRTGDVNVVVIDSGVDFHHPDLATAWAGGINLITPDQPPMDDVSHGTHVAGTIAASNNGFGVVGVAPAGVHLWAVKAIDSTGTGTMEDVIKGLDWVVARKAALGGHWVVNLSLGGDESSDLEREAFQRTADAGIIIVASTGNDATATVPAPVAYPAAYPSVIAVGAVSGTNTHAGFSNSGPELDFVAPGVGVLSTVPSGTKFGSFVRVDGVAYAAKPMVGSKPAGVEGPFVSCGLGNPGDFPASVRGGIALVQRGGDTFAAKTRRAVEAGAVGVVIYNNDTSNYLFTLLPKDDPDAQIYPWPVGVGISQSDGQGLAQKGSGLMTIGYESDDYATKNGTSMSAPHVTGAMATLWSLAPTATPAQIVQALTATARDLGDPGRDDLYGLGLIDLNAAARLLAPAAFLPSTRTGRPYLRRGH